MDPQRALILNTSQMENEKNAPRVATAFSEVRGCGTPLPAHPPTTKETRPRITQLVCSELWVQLCVWCLVQRGLPEQKRYVGRTLLFIPDFVVSFAHRAARLGRMKPKYR